MKFNLGYKIYSLTFFFTLITMIIAELVHFLFFPNIKGFLFIRNFSCFLFALNMFIYHSKILFFDGKIKNIIYEDIWSIIALITLLLIAIFIFFVEVYPSFIFEVLTEFMLNMSNLC